MAQKSSLLLIGILCFDFLFPQSYSTHNGVIHVLSQGNDTENCGISLSPPSSGCFTVAYACARGTSPREVVLEIGTYEESGSVNVIDNLTVSGRSKTKCILYKTNNSQFTLFNITMGGSQLTLTTLTIILTNDSSLSFNFICCTNSSDVIIRACRVTMLSGLMSIDNPSFYINATSSSLTFDHDQVYNITMSGPAYPMIHCCPVETLTLTDCSFANVMCDCQIGGGCFYIMNGSNITLSRCMFTACAASYGGVGVINPLKLVGSLHSCTFWNNTAEGSGGALHVSGTDLPLKVTFDNVTCVDCITKELGGALDLSNYLNVTIDACRFLRCKSLYVGNDGGGAVQMYGNCEGLIRRSTFTSCSASLGGGVLVDSAYVIHMSDCMFVNNEAAIGRDIFVKTGSVTLIRTFTSTLPITDSVNNLFWQSMLSLSLSPNTPLPCTEFLVDDQESANCPLPCVLNTGASVSVFSSNSTDNNSNESTNSDIHEQCIPPTHCPSRSVAATNGLCVAECSFATPTPPPPPPAGGSDGDTGYYTCPAPCVPAVSLGYLRCEALCGESGETTGETETGTGTGTGSAAGSGDGNQSSGGGDRAPPEHYTLVGGVCWERPCLQRSPRVEAAAAAAAVAGGGGGEGNEENSLLLQLPCGSGDCFSSSFASTTAEDEDEEGGGGSNNGGGNSSSSQCVDVCNTGVVVDGMCVKMEKCGEKVLFPTSGSSSSGGDDEENSTNNNSNNNSNEWGCLPIEVGRETQFCYFFEHTDVEGWDMYRACALECPPNYHKAQKQAQTQARYYCEANPCTSRDPLSGVGCSLPDDTFSNTPCFLNVSTGCCVSSCPVFTARDDAWHTCAPMACAARTSAHADTISETGSCGLPATIIYSGSSGSVVSNIGEKDGNGEEETEIRIDGGSGDDDPSCYYFAHTNETGWTQYTSCGNECPPNYNETVVYGENGTTVTNYVCEPIHCEERLPQPTTLCALPDDTSRNTPCFLNVSTGCCVSSCPVFTAREDTQRTCTPMACAARVASEGSCGLPATEIRRSSSSSSSGSVVGNNREEDDNGEKTEIRVGGGGGDDDPSCFFFAHTSETGWTQYTSCGNECPPNYGKKVMHDGENETIVTNLVCIPEECGPTRFPQPVVGCGLPEDVSTADRKLCYLNQSDGSCVPVCPPFTTAVTDTTASTTTTTLPPICTATRCSTRTPLPVDGRGGTNTGAYTCGLAMAAEDPVCYYFAHAGETGWTQYTRCGDGCPPNYAEKTVYELDGTTVANKFCEPKPCGPLRSVREQTNCTVPGDASPCFVLTHGDNDDASEECTTDCGPHTSTSESKLRNACTYIACSLRTAVIPPTTPTAPASPSPSCRSDGDDSGFSCYYFSDWELYAGEGSNNRQCVLACPSVYEAQMVVVDAATTESETETETETQTESETDKERKKRTGGEGRCVRRECDSIIMELCRIAWWCVITESNHCNKTCTDTDRYKVSDEADPKEINYHKCILKNNNSKAKGKGGLIAAIVAPIVSVVGIAVAATVVVVVVVKREKQKAIEAENKREETKVVELETYSTPTQVTFPPPNPTQMTMPQMTMAQLTMSQMTMSQMTIPQMTLAQLTRSQMTMSQMTISGTTTTPGMEMDRMLRQRQEELRADADAMTKRLDEQGIHEEIKPEDLKDNFGVDDKEEEM